MSKVIFDGLVAFLKSYMKLALAEWRFIIRLFKLPFRKNPSAQHLYRAVNLWLKGIAEAFMPSWISMVRKHPTKFSRFMALLRVVHQALLFVYSFIVLR